MKRDRRIRRVALVAAIAILIGAGVVRFAGCYSAPKGYTLVKNRLRLMEETVPFVVGTERLRLAVIDGIWESELRIQDIAVYRGHMTFHGADGSISVITNSSIIVRMNQHENILAVGESSIRLELLGSQLMIFQWSLDSGANLMLQEKYGHDIWRLSPHLLCKESNGVFLIDVPISYSDDFEGSLGKMTISRNWYDGPQWSKRPVNPVRQK